MRLKLSAFPVRGAPLFFLAISLIGGAFGVLLQASNGWNFAWFFPYLLVFSAPLGAELNGKELVLLHGLGLIKERIPLDSIEEVSILSRLEYGTVARHFKAYTSVWVTAVVLSMAYLLLPGEENPIGAYFAPLVISMYTLLFMILTLPMKRKGPIYLSAVLALAFLLLYPLVTIGPETLVPGLVFGLFILWAVRTFQREELILLVADGKSYLLAYRDGNEFLNLLRRAANAQAP
ncbi:hypothetical protein [Palaeococcus ferrophilus]|uniref:hypothetical protein n=1 Tax=Palaeococcus ferrophilus TaxID=83868 RepID=UPI00064E5A2B|nr:hypothetical protein [Palaeococcus ferrophilus]